MKAKRILRDPETGEIVGATRVPFSSKLNLKESKQTFVEKHSRTIILLAFFGVPCAIWMAFSMPELLIIIVVLSMITFGSIWHAKSEKKRDLQAKQEAVQLRERFEREEEKKNERNKLRYDAWLKGTPGKLSQKGFSSLGGKDRDELFFIYQLLMNGGDLNKLQKRLMEIALADSATSKFLELRGSQGSVPSPENSLSPQMPVAFGALGIAAGAGIIQRGQIRQELNEINENLDEVSEDLDEMSGGEADPSGFDFF